MDEQDYSQIDQYDDMQFWRCPQLGGPVTFKYCRMMNEGVPCRRLLYCWGARLDVLKYINGNYTAEEIERAFGVPSKDRLTRIFDAIRKAKEEGPQQEQ